MASPLDLDQLQTFIAIADTGSFTRAAEEVFRTQSAVSMQMRRLEERIGKQLFEKDGRTNRLTEEGERLLAYARRMLRLNRETLAAFDEKRLEGSIRIGILRGHSGPAAIVDALARHIAESLDNITPTVADAAGSFDFAAVAYGRGKRLRPGQVLPGW